jgi:hypothetical protein
VGRFVRQLQSLCNRSRIRIAQHLAVFQKESGKIRHSQLSGVHQHLRFRISPDLQPAIRNEVASQKVLNLMGPGGPGMPDQPQTGDLRSILGLPFGQQIVGGGVQALIGRIPRLFKIVVQTRLVDRTNRCLNI